MNTLTQEQHAAVFTREKSRENAWTRFLNWAGAQQKNSMLWMAVAVTGHGCIFAPITILAVMLSGHNNMYFWSLVLGAMGMVLVSFLAALPTRWTIPIFFLSLLIDLGILLSLLGLGLAGM